MKIFLISDCHGNIDGLMRALEKHKIVDKHGNRQLARKNKVFSIGDLANCVEDSKGGDLACLNLIPDIIDGMIIGNHEFPYLDSGNSFNGFHFDVEVNHKIQLLMAEDFIGGSIQISEFLITHAGLSKEMLSLEMSVSDIHDSIEYHFEARNWNHGFFASIGYARGGMNRCGGIIWCDFDNEFVPTDFPQICGHTPGFVRMNKNALCIDVGAKDQNTEPFILEIS